MNKYFKFSIISSIVILLDYFTKKLIVEKLALHDRIDLLPFLRIVHVENKGAAFGIFSGLDNRIFISLAVIAIILIIGYLIRVSSKLEFYALSLILGGAAGNLMDRLRIGKVIDFIDVFIGKWHWPAFNVADSALTCGIIIFLVAHFRHNR